MKKIWIVPTVLLFFNLYGVSASQNFSFSPIVIKAKYEIEYDIIINSTVEYVFIYSTDEKSWMETARIEVESNATYDLPLIVDVHQLRGILSWTIPVVVNSMHFDDLVYNKTSRTLCSTKDYQSGIKYGEFITISLSTASYTNISFKLNVTQDSKFYLRPEEKKLVEISPSEPIYYGYIFQEQIESSSVIVHVESESDICMTVSIQNISCPVFDSETNIQYTGYWQTVNRQGGITVPREAFPMGFFVVLVVKSDDTACFGSPSTASVRKKIVALTIHITISKHEYIVATGIVISIIFTFCIIFAVSIVITKIKRSIEINQELLVNRDCENITGPVPSPSTIEESVRQRSLSSETDSSLDEDNIDLLEDALSDKEVIRTKLVLSVCDLARKDPKILRHKSRLYLYYLITVAIFYTLPVVQLVITYQNVLHDTGNQDLCYYNFLCAHPFGSISDFNHVLSNFGYIMLGFLFIFLIYTRENNELDREKNKCYGIPQHYGLFYALGTALIMEGILSGSYHVCPNRSNFQFDTSFMYIIAVLCMIKIYHTRHPDINAQAQITFGILAFIILLGLIGVLNGSTSFSIVFTIMHLLICLFLTLEIYYMGQWRRKGICRRIIQSCRYDVHSGIKHLFRPLYPGRFVMLIVANLCNIALAVYGNIEHDKNFATFLLEILMCNLILYTMFYIIMKILNKERILHHTLIYIILSFGFWSAAMYFFINKTISWALTPAQSRLYNRPCILLNFFDSHDIWHFLSALAMFFSFMALLTLDDDLVDVHRSQIPVF